MSLLDDLLRDLAAEGAVVTAAVTGLDPDAWRAPTPAAGWSVATQVAHLVWTDEVATLAARSLPEVGGEQGARAWEQVVLAAMADPAGFVDAAAHDLAGADPDSLLARSETSRAMLAAVLRELEAVPGRPKMPWFGPPMSAVSMATARFMETWAHSLDVHAGLGLVPRRTDRVRHVVELGVRTRGFSFATHEQPVPEAPVHLELVAPGGDTWTWGPEDAPETVTGSAYDFALLVTQRVHRADTDLVATGPGADAWLDLAQAFAGPPGAGREAGAGAVT